MPKSVGIGTSKGGVGKTIVALNIAHRLHLKGYKVALIDADIDNSSFSTFTGANASIGLTEDHFFKPYSWNGIQVFAVSLLASKRQSVSMEAQRYAQMLFDVIKQSKWDAEYFVFDLPGTASDIFRDVMEIMADSLIGNIIIHQPSMVDATVKFIKLHEYFEIPILGLIENMSYFQLGAIKYNVFGKSTVDDLAKEYNIEVLGNIPLSMEIAENVSKNDPIIPEGLAEPIENACKKIVAARVQESGILEKLKGKISDVLKLEEIQNEMKKVLINFIVTANQVFNVNAIRTSSGFREGKPFLFVITDESGTTELASLPLRVTEDRIVQISKETLSGKYKDNLDFEIVVDYRTLARMIMGQRKTRRGDYVPYKPSDSWWHGDLKVYGYGHTQYASQVFRTIFEDEETMNKMRSRFGAVLKGWI